MSDRFYTTFTVSGPDAATAEKAAIEALKQDEYGSWIEATDKYPAHFCTANDSGDVTIDAVATLSRQYPTEIFTLDVAGDYGAGVQGPVIINNGKVRDGRNESPAYGGYDPHCGKCNALVTSPNLRLALGDMAEHKIDSKGHVECQCGTRYEFEIEDGKLVFFGTVYDISEVNA